MEDLKEKTRDLADHVEDIADTFYRLSIVNVTEKAANIVSGVVVTIIVCVLGLFFLFFAGFAFAWWLGDLVNSRAAGFLLAAAFFLLALFVIMYIHKKAILPILRNIIVRKIYD